MDEKGEKTFFKKTYNTNFTTAFKKNTLKIYAKNLFIYENAQKKRLSVGGSELPRRKTFAIKLLNRYHTVKVSPRAGVSMRHSGSCFFKYSRLNLASS